MLSKFKDKDRYTERMQLKFGFASLDIFLKHSCAITICLKKQPIKTTPVFGMCMISQQKNMESITISFNLNDLPVA